MSLEIRAPRENNQYQLNTKIKFEGIAKNGISKIKIIELINDNKLELAEVPVHNEKWSCDYFFYKTGEIKISIIGLSDKGNEIDKSETKFFIQINPYISNEKVLKLRNEIYGFFIKHHQKSYSNRIISIFLIILGIFLSLGVTIAGLLGYGILSGILGVFVTAIISIQTAFSFEEKSKFHRITSRIAENMVTELYINEEMKTQEEHDEILQKYMKLRYFAAESLPDGEGMKVVRKLINEYPENQNSYTQQSNVISGKEDIQ